VGRSTREAVPAAQNSSRGDDGTGGRPVGKESSSRCHLQYTYRVSLGPMHTHTHTLLQLIPVLFSTQFRIFLA
jgi:hypothetical protein